MRDMEKNKSEVKTIECRICNETKAIELFRRDAKSKTGHQNICNECRKQHRRKNGEYARQRAYSYAIKAGQTTPMVSAAYIETILTEACVYCGCDFSEDNVVATCDHVYPQSSSYGGVNIEANVLPACRSCNSTKHDLFAIEAFDKYPERFKPELLRPFVQRFIGGLIKRKLTDIEVEQMIGHLRDEAEEVRRNEAIQCKRSSEASIDITQEMLTAVG